MPDTAKRETIEHIREIIKENIHSSIGTCYTPGSESNRFFAKLATNLPVTRELVRKGELPLEPIEQNLAALALSKFLQSCVTPVQDIENGRAFINPADREPRERLNTCKTAEESFKAVFKTMKGAIDGEQIDDGPKWTIVEDGDGAPIAVQKGITVNSALSLTPITIDGCLIPAGSILDMGFFYEKDGLPLPKAAGIVTSFDSVETVDFLRLSEFAYRLDDGKVMDGTSPSTESPSPLKEYIELAEKCISLSVRI